jgi:hypothetical protein
MTCYRIQFAVPHARPASPIRASRPAGDPAT